MGKPVPSIWNTEMYALMCHQMPFPAEWLIRYITSKWLLPNMYMLMCLQMTE
ncbi:hypothetical protein B7P43_G15942 [Cryptotermes secundus]|uniref:Uncharacterized protein n=1 Tax=Cryptotermes secundus TaxID=105785 RepID=A0A2J7RTG7_9NEOP|nr:hypothetical protein B7P43_G15942 [Cryptotermes secundus]